RQASARSRKHDAADRHLDDEKQERGIGREIIESLGHRATPKSNTGRSVCRAHVAQPDSAQVVQGGAAEPVVPVGGPERRVHSAVEIGRNRGEAIACRWKLPAKLPVQYPNKYTITRT